MSIASSNSTVTFLGQPVRWYVEAAEWPFIGFGALMVLGYVDSFWFDISYLGVVAPVALFVQVVAAVVIAYMVGVRVGARWTQTAGVAGLLAIGVGIISAGMAIIRFHYGWLVFNVIVEPVWSMILAVVVAGLTIGFFNLPRLVRKYVDKFRIVNREL